MAFGPVLYTSELREVESLFGAALAAQPARPVEFTVYFTEGTQDFTAESLAIVDGIFAAIAKRPVADVTVVGHTDTVGSDPFNDDLSRKRAEIVRVGLIAKGLAPDNVVAIGRGKREPIVRTGDGVAEPRNRRVEISVR